MLVLVVGPSGAGKDSLLNGARAALGEDDRFVFARRQITRRADPDGEDHEPVDRESFALRRAAGAYALTWEAHGLWYGVPSDIALELAAGRVVVANVSRAVVAEAARRFPVVVVEITAPAELRAARLGARGREDAEDQARRLAREVPLPEGVRVVRVENGGELAEGVAGLVAALRVLADAGPA